MEIAAFVARYPFIYHMAEAGTWASIQHYGLLSTSAILDLHALAGNARLPYESNHRPAMMTVQTPTAPAMVLRDQIPMAEDRLEKALQGSMSTRAWYELLNGKVFFWATEERLLRLLNARYYRSVEHDVLTVNSESFFATYHADIELCHMNSGNTFPVPHRRDRSIFTSIADYPVRLNGNPIREVAEVTVTHRVPNIDNHVVEVRRMLGATVLDHIYRA